MVGSLEFLYKTDLPHRAIAVYRWLTPHRNGGSAAPEWRLRRTRIFKKRSLPMRLSQQSHFFNTEDTAW